MSVDYSANFGIGYKLKQYMPGATETFADTLHDICEGTTYKLITSGDDYSESATDYYLVFRQDPFLNTLDLIGYKAAMDEFIEKHSITTCSAFGVCGGLLIS